MWLYVLAVFLIVVGIVGGLFGGGIFTIVLIPIALLMLAAAVFFSAQSREAKRREGSGAHATAADRPLPHAAPQPTGREPTSPEGLADARRAQQ